MARRIGVSPTYLSMVERGQVSPPAENKILAIADVIGSKHDELLALAGKISSDVEGLIIDAPAIAELVRRVSKASGKISIGAIIQKAVMSIEQNSPPEEAAGEAARTELSEGEQRSPKDVHSRRAEPVENPDELSSDVSRRKRRKA